MILFLAGTSDARELAIRIQKTGLTILASVVTETAAKSLQEVGIDTRIGRLTDADMIDLIRRKKIRAVVDASHPFAEEASKNALQASASTNVPYIRYERELQQYDDENLIIVRDYEAAAKLAAEKRGVIMLTTGSKTLEIFTKELAGIENSRVIARMLPRIDNMEKCAALGIEQKNIVAMQGPFSKELNKALFEHYGVTLMVTKESGKAGSVDEKIAAALECGIETILIARPAVQYQNFFSSFDGVINYLQIKLTNEEREIYDGF